MVKCREIYHKMDPMGIDEKPLSPLVAPFFDPRGSWNRLGRGDAERRSTGICAQVVSRRGHMSEVVSELRCHTTWETPKGSVYRQGNGTPKFQGQSIRSWTRFLVGGWICFFGWMRGLIYLCTLKTSKISKWAVFTLNWLQIMTFIKNGCFTNHLEMVVQGSSYAIDFVWVFFLINKPYEDLPGPRWCCMVSLGQL